MKKKCNPANLSENAAYAGENKDKVLQAYLVPKEGNKLEEILEGSPTT